jgi:hypothetical protein
VPDLGEGFTAGGTEDANFREEVAGEGFTAGELGWVGETPQVFN